MPNYSKFVFAILGRKNAKYLIVALDSDIRGSDGQDACLTDSIPIAIHKELAKFKLYEVVEGRFEGAALANSAPVIRALQRLGLKTSATTKAKIRQIIEKYENE